VESLEDADPRPTRARFLLLSGLLCSGLAWACASDGAPEPSDSHAAGGQELFREYCASCHGVDARGGGPVASSLSVPPPDLTKLGEKFGRPLPVARMEEFIDGRSMVTAHGRSDMPVWGRDLYHDVPLNAATELNTRSTIRLIIGYLDSIQSTE
jgi:mono/diheme cytochrome c family protein